MDKFTVISISVKSRNLKQYSDWFIGLSLHFTHTVTGCVFIERLLIGLSSHLKVTVTEILCAAALSQFHGQLSN